MQDFGLVSVIMPAYNAERYIKTAIESVLSQTYKNLELIIVNDGSTDGTENIIKSFSDSRIVYIKHESNLGVAEARNSAFKVAKGKFGALIDADDAWLPERLEKMIGVLLNYGSEDHFVNDNHIVCFNVKDVLLKWNNQFKLFYRTDFSRDIIEMSLVDFTKVRCPLMHPIFPFYIVKEKGIFQHQEFVPGEDLAFYFELMLSGLKLIIMKDSYYLYRNNPESLTHKKPRSTLPKIYEYLASKYKFTKEEESAFEKLIFKSRINTTYGTFTYFLRKREIRNAFVYSIKHPYVFPMLFWRLPYSLRYRIREKLVWRNPK